MKTYRVGGSVRDELLGLTVQDNDHVVVGANPEEMVKLGFRPVGVMRRYQRMTDGRWVDALLMDLLADELVR